jgi:hypothetical protein
MATVIIKLPNSLQILGYPNTDGKVILTVDHISPDAAVLLMALLEAAE